MATTSNKPGKKLRKGLEKVEREAPRVAGALKNLLMEYIEEKPKGMAAVTSRYNAAVDRCDA